MEEEERGDDVGRMLRLLRATTAKAIAERATLFKVSMPLMAGYEGDSIMLAQDWDYTNPIPWKPVVDGDFSSDPFLPVTFEDAVRGGKFDK